MTARAAATGAASHEHLHGDEHLGRDLTPSEQRAIAARADEIITERLAEGPRFRDLMDAIDPDGYEMYLHRALMHMDNARAGDPIATRWVLASLWKIQNVVKAAAECDWRDEAEAIAERELP